MQKLIEVPQGCYAEMRVNQENIDVKGFCTFGMGPCCHIIVSNPNTGYMLLCHADQSTNLEDPINGMPAWLEKARNVDGTYNGIAINIGEGPNETRGEARVGSGDTYYEQALKIATDLRIENIIIHPRRDADKVIDSIAITKDSANRSFSIKEFLNKPELEQDFSSLEYDIKVLRLDHLEERPSFQSSYNKAKNYAMQVLQSDAESNKQFPPACVFDGSNNDFLSLGAIEHRYNQSLVNAASIVAIDWSRVNNNAPSRDVTPPGFAERSLSAHSQEGHLTSAASYRSNRSSSEFDSIPEELIALNMNTSSQQSNSPPASEVESNSYSSDSDHITNATNEGTHLTRFEKSSTSQPKPKFMDLLCDGLSEATKAKIAAMREEVTSPSNKTNSDVHSLSTGRASPKITLMPESNHKLDHKSNVQELMQMINNGKIDSNTFICLERKESGDHFGMKDVKLLASILEQNKANPKEAIAVSPKVQNSLIYQDALLYNAAKEKGIEVVGIEGKQLLHSKESPEYNKAREAHMAKHIEQISSAGKNIIFSVGAAHINGLKARLPSAQISADIRVTKERVKFDQVVSHLKKQTQNSPAIPNNTFIAAESSKNSHQSFSR
jgi:hypothetical protein